MNGDLEKNKEKRKGKNELLISNLWQGQIETLKN
jgi:hypothetical protein